MQNFRKIQYLAIFSFLFWPFISYASCGCAQSGQSSELNVQIEQYNLDQNTVKKGFTFPGFLSTFLVGISADVIAEPSDVILKKIQDPNMLPLKDQTLITDIFEYDIINKETYDPQRPIFLTLAYNSTSNHLKKVMIYDKIKSVWTEVPSKNDIKNKIIKAYIHLPYARLAVFEDNNILQTGTATWYKYKGGLFAASPDYPKGTKLKVTNIGKDSPNKGKSVIVKINDYGPDRAVYPDRIIDLDKVAFKKIGNYRGGTIEVLVEKVK